MLKQRSEDSQQDSIDVLDLYHDLVETSQDLIWQCDSQGRYVYLNPAWEDVFGYKISEMLGRKFSEFQHPKEASRDIELFRKLLNGEMVKGYETVHLAKSGLEIHLSFSAKSVHDKDGTVCGTRGIAHDIGARKQAEIACRDSELKFTFNSAPVLLSISDLSTGIYLEVNEEAERISGFRRDEIIGKTAAEIGWISAAERAKLVSEVKSIGRIDHLEMEFRCKDGHRISGIVKGEIIRFMDRDCLLTVTVDITSRKQAEEALRESEGRYRALFMSMEEGFYQSEIVRDHNGEPHDYRYIEVNPAFEKIVGLTRNELIGRRFHELVPVDTTGWIKNYCEIARTGESRTHDFYSPEFNKYFETYAYKTSEDRISVFVRDVTERKRTEESLRTMQKLESLGVLAGGIAHDFNNLLGGIFGYIDIAAECENMEMVQHCLAKTLHTIDRARGLTRQLLTFAKGGAPIKKKDYLFPFVSDAAHFALCGSRVTCSCKIPDDVLPCKFDRNQIGQVIDNIVINAQQAMPDGGTIYITAENVNIDTGTHPTLQKGTYVKLSVRDTGIGMPPEMIPKIFDPFYTTKSTGHGLGLATSYSIVKQHEGCIEVESAPGKGSTFHVFLRACADVEGDTDSQPVPEHRGCGTVIIMDDEEVMREIISSMLERFGYTVLRSTNGDEALEYLHKVEKTELRFMVLDLTIPNGKGGKEIIGTIRAINAELPVFVASGYAEDPVMAYPKEFGFSAGIGKPFTRRELAILLQKYLTNAGDIR
jgi:PAS domain S-box-containing protein